MYNIHYACRTMYVGVHALVSTLWFMCPLHIYVDDEKAHHFHHILCKIHDILNVGNYLFQEIESEHSLYRRVILISNIHTSYCFDMFIVKLTGAQDNPLSLIK